VTLGLAERRVCRVLRQARSTQRYQREPSSDEAPLTAAIIALASQYGRYGYRQVTRRQPKVSHHNHERMCLDVY
jgi:putative transposase